MAVQPVSGNNAASSERYHTAGPNETLSEIAKRYNTTVEEIVKLNNIKNPDRIYKGQILRIPASKNVQAATAPQKVSVIEPVSTDTIGDTADIKPTEERVEGKFLNKMTKAFDYPKDGKFPPEIKIYTADNGEKFLKITRPKDSPDSENGLYNFGEIKNLFLVQDESFLKSNGGKNGLAITSGKRIGNISQLNDFKVNEQEIRKGGYVLVKIADIGEKKEGKRFGMPVDSERNTELKSARNEYLENYFRYE